MTLFDDLVLGLPFYIAYKLYGIYWGTFVLIIASGLLVLYRQVRYKKVAKIYWIIFIGTLIFGGATIIFHNSLILKWNVSIIYWLMGLVFAGSHHRRLSEKTIFERMSASTGNVPLSNASLRKLNMLWGMFFIFLGGLNIYIAYHYSTDVWVKFKMFGIFGLTIGFLILQLPYIFYLAKQQK